MYEDFCPATRTMLYWVAFESSASPMSLYPHPGITHGF